MNTVFCFNVSQFFIALLFLTLSSPALTKTPVAPKADFKTTLALNWKPEPQFGGFYAAEAEGFFKQNKLDVTIQQGGSGTPTVQMVAAGKVDFAIVSADEILISRQNGSDVVALFAVYQTNPQGIMVHAERKMKTIGDVFAQPGILAMQSGLPYAEFLKKKYPNPKVKIVPYAGGISSFLADPQFSQQCFVTSEPLAAKKAGKNPQTFLIAEAGYNPYTTVVVTRESFWKKNPEIVKNFTKAIRLGWKSYLQNPDKTNLKMQALNPSMDLETFKNSSEAQLKLIKTASDDTLGEMSEIRWQELINQLLDLKVLKKEASAKSVFIPFTKGE